MKMMTLTFPNVPRGNGGTGWQPLGLVGKTKNPRHVQVDLPNFRKGPVQTSPCVPLPSYALMMAFNCRPKKNSTTKAQLVVVYLGDAIGDAHRQSTYLLRRCFRMRSFSPMIPCPGFTVAIPSSAYASLLRYVNSSECLKMEIEIVQLSTDGKKYDGNKKMEI